MYRAFGKRLIDVVAAGGVLVALAPVMIACALLVKISSPGPAIFRQQRIGRGGEPFLFYKFRTMPADTGDVASDRLGTVTIGPIGRFLRRSNLDELPQLYNILRGDMSLIGPRPPISSQTDLVDMRRDNGALQCRPGLTGLAQVNSFDGMSAGRKAAFDGEYAAQISLAHDVAIVLKTFRYLTRPPPKY